MRKETNTMDQPVSTADVAHEMDQRATQEAPHSNAPLLAPEVAQRLLNEWSDVQASFVDEPRKAVQRGDELVAYAIKQIAETFARERSGLEAQWDREGDVSTEDLRVALTRYRSFFHRLLSM